MQNPEYKKLNDSNDEKVLQEQIIKNEIRSCLQDYSNNFIALSLVLQGSGIKDVQKLIKGGYRVLTVEDYLKKYKLDGGKTISIEYQKDPLFIEKARELNELANKTNSLGEKISETYIKETIEKVTKITHF
jgi:hypothetical protein